MLHPHTRKVVGALLCGLSLIIIWSEATILTGRRVDLSPFSRAIRGAVPNELGVQLLTTLPLAYICVCTYFALFRINAFDYNKLLPRATTGAALMQNGSLMCRFAPATCWNFLHMIHMDGRVDGQKTVFTENMGTMDVLPVLGKHLNVSHHGCLGWSSQQLGSDCVSPLRMLFGREFPGLYRSTQRQHPKRTPRRRSTCRSCWWCTVLSPT